MFASAEETRYEQQQYLSYLSVPTISIEKCNSSSHYAGSLLDDAICSDLSSSSGTTCYVSVSVFLLRISQLFLVFSVAKHSNISRPPSERRRRPVDVLRHEAIVMGIARHSELPRRLWPPAAANDLQPNVQAAHSLDYQNHRQRSHGQQSISLEFRTNPK